MTVDFDPRLWNLLAGLALVAGCSGRTISADGDSTDSINDGETTQNPDSGPDSDTDTGPECINDGDCPYGYYCSNNSCVPVPPDDGEWYDCYSDAECGQLELCDDGYCQYVDSPPACNSIVPQGSALEIPDVPLRLAFADVDDDGARELVVASQTQLHVYESGSPTPVSYARGIESDSIDAMVGGQFDDLAGEDVIILQQDEFDVHGSDGLGNLLPALPSPSPVESARGIETGHFADNMPFTDLLVWGGPYAAIVYTSIGQAGMLDVEATSASTRDIDTPAQGFSLLHDGNVLTFYDITGTFDTDRFLRGEPPSAQAGINPLGVPHEFGSSIIADWTLVEEFIPPNNADGRWRMPGQVTYMRGGDLDGLENGELALIVDGTLWLYFKSNYCLLQVPLDGPVTLLAFGDHDGDGDDELAVSTATNTVSIVDIE